MVVQRHGPPVLRHLAHHEARPPPGAISLIFIVFHAIPV